MAVKVFSIYVPEVYNDKSIYIFAYLFLLLCILLEDNLTINFIKNLRFGLNEDKIDKKDRFNRRKADKIKVKSNIG